VLARAGGPCARRGVYAGAALSAAVLAASGALKKSAGADGVAVKLPATGALEESSGANGVAVELPAIVGVGDDGAGDASGCAESAIAGCRSLSRYVPSVVRRPRRFQVVNRVTATAPAAVRFTKPVPTVRSTKLVPSRVPAPEQRSGCLGSAKATAALRQQERVTLRRALRAPTPCPAHIC